MKKSEGRDKCFALGTWVLAKWVALWRKLFIEGRRAKWDSLDLLYLKEYHGELAYNHATPWVRLFV